MAMSCVICLTLPTQNWWLIQAFKHANTPMSGLRCTFHTKYRLLIACHYLPMPSPHGWLNGTRSQKPKIPRCLCPHLGHQSCCTHLRLAHLAKSGRGRTHNAKDAPSVGKKTPPTRGCFELGWKPPTHKDGSSPDSWTANSWDKIE
jgi:hypothetical protein